ncbi:nicotinamide riboside transporter [Exiguobacterium phage vB_EalM-132]|nr:nicotinamide riboside transporter [Exiguobacterium phage vB_EalM-132]
MVMVNRLRNASTWKSALLGWTLFEKVWLLTFFSITLYLFFAFEDSFIGLVSSLAGMLCVVLVAKGKIANYYFGIVQVLGYGWISYSYGLFGEVILNLAIYLPLQFVGIYYWNKSAKQTLWVSSKMEDIAVKRMTKEQWMFGAGWFIGSLVVLIPALYFLGGKYVGIDGITTMLSIGAQILMIKRFAEQWLLWIVVNILSIIMWAYVLLDAGGNDWNILVMWVAFLFNSIYGYINWIKMSKEVE